MSTLVLFDDAEKREIISTGPALFIEGIRERTEPAGKTIPLTSWFYSLGNSVKVALQSGQLVLSSINELGNIYDIELYKNTEFQNRFAYRMEMVANATGLDFERRGNKIISNISRTDARSAYKEYLQKEYEYSVTKNLRNKNFDAHAEIIMWHLLNDIYNFPRPVGYERKLSFDIINDYSGDSTTKSFWDPDKLQNTPIYIDGLMRALIETKKFDVVSLPDIGQMYSPPRFSSIDKRILFSGPHSALYKELVEMSQRAPAWPVYASKENNDACFHLNSAGLIEYVSEKDREIRDYGYIIPRDYFWEIHIKLNYNFIDPSEDNNSDTTLTEQIFRTVGRARLISYILNRIEPESLDSKLTAIERGEVESTPILEKILNPMIVRGSLEKTNEDKIQIVSGMERDISIMLDIWQNMEMVDLNIPEEEFAKEKRSAQTRAQFKKKAFLWLKN